MRIILMTLVWLITFPVAAAEIQYLQSKDSTTLQFALQVDPSQFAISVGDDGWDRIHHVGVSMAEKAVGKPDIPVFRTLVHVQPGVEYSMRVRASSRREVKIGSLAPAQADILETETRKTLEVNQDVYGKNAWFSYETATLGKESKIGGAAVRMLTISPFAYQPKAKKLALFRSVTVELIPKSAETAKAINLTKFAAHQLQGLAANQVSNLTVNKSGRVLILSSDELLLKAREFALRYVDMGYDVTAEVVDGMSTGRVKSLIQDEYNNSELEAVLLFGDEDHVPLYYWSRSLPGDSYYSYLEGGDWYSDVALGRIPVSNVTEADYMISKSQRYGEIAGDGHTSRRVMLLAHKENYPGKYTGNQEDIRRADNPRGLMFTTHYGGAGARNADVLADVPEGYAIINYRGHGSSSSWTGWDYRGYSFGSSQISALDNPNEGLAVFFNIACTNGAVQNDGESMAERLLLSALGSGFDQGAVAVLAATAPSYTETNHRFDRYLFENLQTQDDLSLGNINGLANNELVRDSGGSLPTNVKMYILFGDPLLSPWL